MNAAFQTDSHPSKHMHHSGICTIFTLILCTVLLSGCTNQKKDELEAYRVQMETFFNSLSSCSEAIDAIDADDENASADLITVIDEMAGHCGEAAAVTPPEGYENVQTLAADAEGLLRTASEDFHTAFDGEYDEAAYNEGLAAYDNANTKIRGMITLLRGESE